MAAAGFAGAGVVACAHGETLSPAAPPATIEGAQTPLSPRALARATLLDGLFEALKNARTPAEARSIETSISTIFARSGSPTIDLLMARGAAAFGVKDFDKAMFYFNETVALVPGYAEGWNKRAAIYYLRRDYGPALRDTQQALKLEPRDFKTMMGFALVLEDLGDKKTALDLYRRALALDPWLDDAKASIKRLQIEVEGRGI